MGIKVRNEGNRKAGGVITHLGCLLGESYGGRGETIPLSHFIMI